MNGNADFVRALSEYLALHTEQSASHLSRLIDAFMHGKLDRPFLDPAMKTKLLGRLKADMQGHEEVPSFLQNYLFTHVAHGGWPPQASFVAARYMNRKPEERFVSFAQRQRRIADLDSEPIRGTELGLRQMLYSQGAGPLFRWRGFPCFKSHYDLAIYAMLLDELRPATIIELGSGAGGSSLLFADLCGSMGLSPTILSIDTAAAQVNDPRISFVQSDCVSWLADAVKSKREFGRPCLMIEDFHGDLASCFANIDTILADGDYLVIEDSLPKQARISELITSRPYLIDTKYTDFFGVNCTTAMNSILKKGAGASPR